MKLIAKIEYISPAIEITKKNWEKTMKQIVWFEEYDEERDQLDSIAIDFLGDKTEILKPLTVWDLVEVFFHTSYNRFPGTDWEEKIFNSIRGWKIVVKKVGGKVAEKDDWLPF